jgi:hypothetical protein
VANRFRSDSETAYESALSMPRPYAQTTQTQPRNKSRGAPAEEQPPNRQYHCRPPRRATYVQQRSGNGGRQPVMADTEKGPSPAETRFRPGQRVGSIGLVSGRSSVRIRPRAPPNSQVRASLRTAGSPSARRSAGGVAGAVWARDPARAVEWWYVACTATSTPAVAMGLPLLVGRFGSVAPDPGSAGLAVPETPGPCRGQQPRSLRWADRLLIRGASP